MPAFQHIPLSIIEPITPQKLAQGGAFLGQVPAWDGVQYTPQNPVSWFNAGSALGKISEINILGSGVFSSVTGNRATLTINAGAITVNGQPVTAINPGANMSASISGGIATLNATSGGNITMQNGNGVPLLMNPGTGNLFNVKGLFAGAGINISDFGTQLMISASNTGGSISLNQTGIGAPIIVSPGTASAFSLKGLVGVNGISVQDFGNYLQINGSGVGGSYTHPSYTPQTFTPTLVGNTLTVAGFSRDSIGSVDTITPLSFTLSSLGGGITGIALNGTGNYTNIQFGSGFSVSGNFVNAIGSGHTIGNGALGAGIVSLPGFAASHTLKGLVGGGATTVTDMGSHILISSTGGSSSSSSVEVRKDGITVNPMAFILNFTGAGVSVANGVGVEINIPGGSGSAGVSSFNSATGAISLIAGTNTSITNFGGGLFQINATAGSSSLIGFSANGLSVTSNSVSLAMASLASPGAMPLLSGISTQFLNGNGLWSTPASNMPVGFAGDIMWHNGSGWFRHPDLLISGNTPFSSGWRLTNWSGNTSHGLSFATSIQLTAESHLYLSSNIGDVRISSPAGSIAMNAIRHGFFGATPVTRPVIVAGNQASIEAALISLGLARY
jgi:hypothetical protein